MRLILILLHVFKGCKKNCIYEFEKPSKYKASGRKTFTCYMRGDREPGTSDAISQGLFTLVRERADEPRVGTTAENPAAVYKCGRYFNFREDRERSSRVNGTRPA